MPGTKVPGILPFMGIFYSKNTASGDQFLRTRLHFFKNEYLIKTNNYFIQHTGQGMSSSVSALVTRQLHRPVSLLYRGMRRFPPLHSLRRLHQS